MVMGAVVSIILLIPSVIAFFIDQKIQKKQGVVLNAKSIVYRAKKIRYEMLFSIFILF